MNRHVKLVLVMAVLATFLLAIAAIAWRVHLVGTVGLPLRPRPLAPWFLLAVPVALAAILAATSRHLDGHRPGISEDNPRHLQATLVILFLFVTACEAWLGVLYVEAHPPGGEAVVRFALVFLGMLMAVSGNRFAKLSAPPNRTGGWTRLALRTGWISAVAGLALAVCAMTLPLRPLFAACLIAAAILTGAGLLLRHRPSRR